MKHLLFFALMLVSIGVSAQYADTTITKADYKEIKAGSGQIALKYDFLSDTIDATGAADTFLITLPHTMASLMTGDIYFTLDTFPGQVDLAGGFKVYTGQCATCPFTEIASGTLPLEEGIANATTDTLLVDDLVTWVRVIVSAGTGIIRMYITLKP